MKKIIMALVFLPSLAFGRSEFIVKPYSARGTLELTLGPKLGEEGVSDDAVAQTYSPNITNQTGVTVGWKEFSFSYGSTIPVSDDLKATQGKTKYNDFQFNLFFKKIGVDLYYQKYKGFYISNASDADLSTDENGREIKPQFPNMEMKKYGINIFYVWDPKAYSIPAAYSQTERQTRSGWSWIAMATANDVNISNRSQPILTSTHQANFSIDGGFSGARMKSLGGNVGVGGTYVFLRSFFLTGQVLWGKAITEFRGNGIANRSVQNLTSDTVNTRAGIGYNGKTYFIGVNFIYDSIKTSTDFLSIEPKSNLFTYYLGMRF